ncbi:MAG: hypothetical protein ACRD68_18635, partial [Pyrinomonadaceae bacterium]
FWPVVVQKAEGNEETTTNFFEMKLAWVECFNEQWGARKLSADALKVYGKWDELDLFSSSPAGLTSAGEWLTCFRLVEGESLIIECRQAFSAALGANILGRFVMDACTGTMFVDNTETLGDEIVAPSGVIAQRMRFFLTTGFEEAGTPTSFTLMSGPLDASGELSGEAEEVEVLGKVTAPGVGVASDEHDGRYSAGTFGNYLYPHQHTEFASQHGVFLDDQERVFHVMPQSVIDHGVLYETDNIAPTDVGTAYSRSDVFTPQFQQPSYEPELSWETIDTVRVGKKYLPAGVSASGAAAGATATLSNGARVTKVEASFDRLTTSDLQMSQYKLVESDFEADPFASVQ